MSGRPAGFSDDEDEYDNYNDFGDYYHHSSSNESGYEEQEPATITPLTNSQLLQQAIKDCNMDEVIRLLTTLNNYINFTFDDGRIPLTYAIEVCQPVVLEFILGYEYNKQIPLNRKLHPSPLMLACKLGSAESPTKEDYYNCIRLLLEAGIDTHYVDMYGVNALMTACSLCDKHIIELLLDHTTTINDADNEGSTALFYAVKRGDENIVNLVISRGADIKKTDKRKRFAYMIAEEKGLSNLVEILKPHGIKLAEKRAHEENIIRTEIEKVDWPLYKKEMYDMVCSSGIGMNRYASNFVQEGYDLRQFLMLKDEQKLKDLGIPFSRFRNDLLNKIKEFHSVTPWEKKSLGIPILDSDEKKKKITEGENLKKHDEIDLILEIRCLNTMLRQLSVLRTSTMYLLGDLKDEEIHVEEKEFLKNSLKQVVDEIYRIRNAIERIKVTAGKIREKSKPYISAQEV